MRREVSAWLRDTKTKRELSRGKEGAVIGSKVRTSKDELNHRLAIFRAKVAADLSVSDSPDFVDRRYGLKIGGWVFSATHVENFLFQNCNILPVLSVLK